MKKILLSALCLITFSGSMRSNDTTLIDSWEKDCIQTTYWGIMLSTTDYKSAYNYAIKTAEVLGLEFSDRGYVYSETEMLQDTVACGCGEIHGYIPRGRYDNGEYVSIEIKGDYYVVVCISGDKETEEFKGVLNKAKSISPDSYVLPQEVWMCCMH